MYTYIDIYMYFCHRDASSIRDIILSLSLYIYIHMYTHTKSSCQRDSYSRHHTRLRINGTSLRLNSTGKITFCSFYVESLHFESFNLSTNTAVSAIRFTLVLRFLFDWGLNKIFTWPLSVSVAKMHIVGCPYGIWGLGISHISIPPSEVATNFWGAKDAPGKMQSFCALRKVPISGSKITIYRVLTPKILPHTQNCTNFLADSTSLWAGFNMHKKLPVFCCNVPLSNVTAFLTPNTGHEKPEINRVCVPMPFGANCLTLKKINPHLHGDTHSI